MYITEAFSSSWYFCNIQKHIKGRKRGGLQLYFLCSLSCTCIFSSSPSSNAFIKWFMLCHPDSSPSDSHLGSHCWVFFWASQNNLRSTTWKWKSSYAGFNIKIYSACSPLTSFAWEIGRTIKFFALDSICDPMSHLVTEALILHICWHFHTMCIDSIWSQSSDVFSFLCYINFFLDTWISFNH